MFKQPKTKSEREALPFTEALSHLDVDILRPITLRFKKQLKTHVTKRQLLKILKPHLQKIEKNKNIKAIIDHVNISYEEQEQNKNYSESFFDNAKNEFNRIKEGQWIEFYFAHPEDLSTDSDIHYTAKPVRYIKSYGKVAKIKHKGHSSYFTLVVATFVGHKIRYPLANGSYEEVTEQRIQYFCPHASQLIALHKNKPGYFISAQDSFYRDITTPGKGNVSACFRDPRDHIRCYDFTTNFKWKLFVRQLCLAFFKNYENPECHLAKLPLEIIYKISSYL